MNLARAHFLFRHVAYDEGVSDGNFLRHKVRRTASVS